MMLKRLLCFIVLAGILVCAGCDGNMAVWSLTSQNTDLKTLVGYNASGVEIGGMATITPTDDVEWGPEPTGVGFYVGADATWEVTAADTKDPAPFPIELLDGLQAVPYGRVEFLDDIDNENFGNLQPQWVGGTRFLLGDDGKVAIAVEYSDGDQAPSDVYIGASLRF